MDCLKSLISQMYKNFQVAIVDNTPGYKEYHDLKKHINKSTYPFPIQILKPKFNLGFAAGNNYALRRLFSPFYLLLNCDTEIEKDTLQKCINYLKNHEDVAMICPKILFFSEKNRIWYAGAIVNPRSLYFIYHIGLNQRDSPKFNQITETAYANGAALFTRKSVLDKIGLMDEIYFMFSEETDWNYAAKKFGFKIAYYPEACVYHKVEIINETNRLGFRKNPFQIYLYTRNKLIFMIKYFSIKEILFYICTHQAKTFLFEIMYSVVNHNLDFFTAQIRALLMGMLIGFRRRTNQTCNNIMRKEMHFLNKFTKISRSTKTQ